MNIFEYATRNALRYASAKGQLSTEDLWNLPLTSKNGANLDDVAKECHRSLKTYEEESFVEPIKQIGVEAATVRLEIAKHIIAVKLARLEQNRVATENRAKKQRILEIIANKQDEALSAKSIEDLNKMVEGL